MNIKIKLCNYDEKHHIGYYCKNCLTEISVLGNSVKFTDVYGREGFMCLTCFDKYRQKINSIDISEHLPQAVDYKIDYSTEELDFIHETLTKSKVIKSKDFINHCFTRDFKIGKTELTKGYKVMVAKDRYCIPYTVEYLIIYSDSKASLYLKGFSDEFDAMNFIDYEPQETINLVNCELPEVTQEIDSGYYENNFEEGDSPEVHPDLLNSKIEKKLDDLNDKLEQIMLTFTLKS